MPWRVLAFALGVWLLQQSAVLPAPTLLTLLGLGGGVLMFLRRHSVALVGAVLLGFVWAGGFAHWRLADALPAESEGRDIEVTGVVAELPQRFERGEACVVAGEHGDFFSRMFHAGQFRQGDRLVGGQIGHVGVSVLRGSKDTTSGGEFVQPFDALAGDGSEQIADPAVSRDDE